MPKKRFTLVIDEELYNFLENEKWRLHMSKNQLIVKILSDYMAENSSSEEKKHGGAK